MSSRLHFCFALGLLLGSFGAAAQTAPLAAPAPPPLTAEPAPPAAEPAPLLATELLPATVPERAQQQAAALADALQLKARQVATLRAALQIRLEGVETLSHLLFTSELAATAAADAVDFRYYATVGKVLTPAQFHKLLQLDEQAATSVPETPLVLRGH